MGRFSRKPNHIAPTDRTFFRNAVGHLLSRPSLANHANYLRDHITCPLNDDGISDPHILSIDFILVVEGGMADLGTPDPDRLKLSNGRHNAGPSD
jgi:hypothetical protein